jgi:hypothetical protein
MPLLLPTDIPIAAASPTLLDRLGERSGIAGVRDTNGFVFKEYSGAPAGVWCRPFYRDYRAAWSKASAQHLVEPLAGWGADIDLDHLLARCTVRANGLANWYVRLHPVYSEVNRAAGASRERYSVEVIKPALVQSGIIFASQLQVLKIIGHPVGTAAVPESIFEEEE